jgi:hypothetical protein
LTTLSLGCAFFFIAVVSRRPDATGELLSASAVVLSTVSMLSTPLAYVLCTTRAGEKELSSQAAAECEAAVVLVQVVPAHS